MKICLVYLTVLLLGTPLSFAKGERISLIAHGGSGNPFWSVVFKGAKKAANNLGVNLKILFPNKDGDQPGTTQKLSEAISTNPDGIAVTLASAAHCEFIKEARGKGIPLVIFNARAIPSSEKCPYQAYVGMDEYLAGKMSAKRFLKVTKKRGRVVIGLTEAGHAGLQARAKGIEEVLTKAGIKVDTIDIGNDPSAVPLRMKGYLARNQKELAAIFTPAPNGMHPVIRMMENDPEGLGTKYAAGFDLTPLIIKGINKGLVDHTVDQQPYLQGYYSVLQLVMAIRGKFSPLNMDTGTGLVDKKNAKPILKLVKNKIR